MHSVNNFGVKRISRTAGIQIHINAQRICGGYGVGDMVAQEKNIIRGMGGISAGYTNPNSTDKNITPAFLSRA